MILILYTILCSIDGLNYKSLILPVKPIYLEPVAPRQANISGKDRHPWFQIYRELEDEGMGLPGVQKTYLCKLQPHFKTAF